MTEILEPEGQLAARHADFDLDPEQLALIRDEIAASRPAIVADGGDIELVAVIGDVVRVRLTGACTHCALAGQTLGGIRRRIVARLGLPVRVLPALGD